MKLSKVLMFFALAALSVAQSKREPERPLKQPVRGVHGAIAAGSEWATEAGMHTYYKGGNAVDVGVARMFAGSVSELSHYGFGGEAYVLVVRKDALGRARHHAARYR
jgi:gamma-glutamyltranspeptidase/glutathione hydrolase